MGAPDARQGGFTFIEMLVVVTVLAILTAVIVPIYGNSISAMRARSARGDFVALLFHAQERAVREAREIRVCLNAEDRSYWMEGWVSGIGDDKAFDILKEGPHTGVYHFPDSVVLSQIRARSDRGRDTQFFACYPNGASDRASIRFSSGERGAKDITIATTGALGGIEVTP